MEEAKAKADQIWETNTDTNITVLHTALDFLGIGRFQVQKQKQLICALYFQVQKQLICVLYFQAVFPELQHANQSFDSAEFAVHAARTYLLTHARTPRTHTQAERERLRAEHCNHCLAGVCIGICTEGPDGCRGGTCKDSYDVNESLVYSGIHESDQDGDELISAAEFLRVRDTLFVDLLGFGDAEEAFRHIAGSDLGIDLADYREYLNQLGRKTITCDGTCMVPACHVHIQVNTPFFVNAKRGSARGGTLAFSTGGNQGIPTDYIYTEAQDASEDLVATGILRFRLLPERFATIVVTVAMVDDGGVAHGGRDTTLHNVTLHIRKINAAPYAVVQSALPLLEASVEFEQALPALPLVSPGALETSQTVTIRLTTPPDAVPYVFVNRRNRLLQRQEVLVREVADAHAAFRNTYWCPNSYNSTPCSDSASTFVDYVHTSAQLGLYLKVQEDEFHAKFPPPASRRLLQETDLGDDGANTSASAGNEYNVSFANATDNSTNSSMAASGNTTTPANGTQPAPPTTPTPPPQEQRCPCPFDDAQLERLDRLQARYNALQVEAEVVARALKDMNGKLAESPSVSLRADASLQSFERQGVLHFILAPFASGSGQLTFRLSDDGGREHGGQDSANVSMTIIVHAVNDRPYVRLPTALVVVEDAASKGLLTLRRFAQALTPGAADESWQTLSFQINVEEFAGSEFGRRSRDFLAFDPLAGRADSSALFASRACTHPPQCSPGLGRHQHIGYCTHSRRASGLTWRKIGATRPQAGQQLSNDALSEALRHTLTLRPSQFAQFGIRGLRLDHFVASGGFFFEPTEASDEADDGPDSFWLSGNTAVYPPSSGAVHVTGTEQDEACGGVLPTIDRDGVFRMRSARDQHGFARLWVTLRDDGGRAFGGVDSFGPVPVDLIVLPQPRVFAVIPRFGPTTPGALVTLLGAHFGPREEVPSPHAHADAPSSTAANMRRRVSLGGVECLDAWLVSDSEIVCEAPGGIGGGAAMVELLDDDRSRLPGAPLHATVHDGDHWESRKESFEPSVVEMECAGGGTVGPCASQQCWEWGNCSSIRAVRRPLKLEEAAATAAGTTHAVMLEEREREGEPYRATVPELSQGDGVVHRWRRAGALPRELSYTQISLLLAGSMVPSTPTAQATGFLALSPSSAEAGTPAAPAASAERTDLYLSRGASALAFLQGAVYVGGSFAEARRLHGGGPSGAAWRAQQAQVRAGQERKGAVDVSVGHVTMYDGHRVSPLGLGVDGEVLAMTEFQGNLVVGGAFTLVRPAPELAREKNANSLDAQMADAASHSAITTGSIAAWNVTARRWASLPGLPASGLPGVVHCLAAAPGSRFLYAGGAIELNRYRQDNPPSLETADGVESVHGVAAFDARERRWFPLGPGVTNGLVFALLLVPREFYWAANDGRAHASTAAPSPRSSPPRQNEDAAGINVSMNCSNESWLNSTSNVSGNCSTAFSRNATTNASQGKAKTGAEPTAQEEEEEMVLFAGGDFRAAGGNAAAGIAVWDSRWQTWHSLGVLDGAVYALASLDGWVYAGGDFQVAGGSLDGSVVAADHVARWKDGVWYAVVGGVGGPVYSLLAVAGCMYVGGRFDRVCVSAEVAAELQGLGRVPAGTRRAVRCAEETTPLLFDAAQNAARVCHFVASNATMAEASTVNATNDSFNATNDSFSLNSATNATNSSFDRVSSPPRLRREQWESLLQDRETGIGTVRAMCLV